jgi:hypothetical protein
MIPGLLILFGASLLVAAEPARGPKSWSSSHITWALAAPAASLERPAKEGARFGKFYT